MRLFNPFSALLVSVQLLSFSGDRPEPGSWIRINLLGYKPKSSKVAVWCSKGTERPDSFQLVEVNSGAIAYRGAAGKTFGAYGPYSQTLRIDFSTFQKAGNYYLKAGTAVSSSFRINDSVYKGTADFCLRYMRQQRCGYNPYLKDSCHTQDGYMLYGPLPDSTYVNATGGWHDASDYLQYVTTSANATYHLLMAWRDFPGVFSDEKLANGLEGRNGQADVLDEAKWGLDWLLKMHPSAGMMFNQVADDRDHLSMRIPKEDSQYGKGFQRPVYFIDGKPQQRGKFLNDTKGTSSSAAKIASSFALGGQLFQPTLSGYAEVLKQRAKSAYQFALKKPGVTQTVSVRSPYIYAEENWTDDMELAAANLHLVKEAGRYARLEPLTPWLITDTAKHYQWYPFINLGHAELARQLKGRNRDTLTGYYRKGILEVWNRARQNAFYRGVPYIWCSNNLTVSFAIQCYWYRQLTGDTQFDQLEQANFDWIFGCNPWGTSMVYGLPANGDTPTDPHSAFTHLKQYPIDGGLVDGPVYTSIYKNLIGIQLFHEDGYAPFQSELAVYHDDYGDYSTNEPTMDGTASLIYLLAAQEAKSTGENAETFHHPFIYSYGAIIRGDTQQKKIALVFTGDTYAEGTDTLLSALKNEGVKASFFLTGRFLRNPTFQSGINQLVKAGHYLGPHSDQHLLYADWNQRERLLVTKDSFLKDLRNTYAALKQWGIDRRKASYFLPPFEWYNDSIAAWTRSEGLQLINYTPGTISMADYTVPDDKNYRTANAIFQSISDQESRPDHLNGFILLLHTGAGPKRPDPFYNRLPELLKLLKKQGYQMVTVEELLRF